MAKKELYPLKNIESLVGDLTYLQSKGIQRKRIGRESKIDGKEYELLSSTGAEVVVMTDSGKGDIVFPFGAKVKLVNPLYEPSARSTSNGAYIVPRVWVDDIVEVK